MQRLITTIDAAIILDCSITVVRKRMWAHGFDPVLKKGDRKHYWKVVDVKQVREERIAWKLDEERVRARVKLEFGEVSWASPKAAVASAEARTARRAVIRAQLESAPVHAADIDYLAQRAGERRSSRALGPTQHALDAVK